MTKTRSTKSALISSVVALLLCFAMLVGSTFAWFTDSVTSAGNIIQSGTLDVELYYADGKEAVESADWKNADGVAIYTADQLWEPGYTDAKHLKVSNEGSLALKYQLAIVPTGEVSELADVIDVYYIENGQQITDRTDLDAMTKRGTLAELINTGIATGNLDDGENFVATIVLKMQETADNKYQNLSIGDDFTIQLLATQYTAEEDGFDNTYDEDAWMDGMIVYSEADLKAALANGGNVTLGADVEVTETIVVPASETATFSLRSTAPATVLNLNGYSIKAAMAKDSTTSDTGVLVNEGTLIIKGDNTSVFSNTTENGGSLIYNTGTLILDGGNYVGAPRIEGGYPSYIVRNNHGGTVTLTGGVSVTSYWGAFSNYNKSILNIENATIYHDTEISGTTYYLACAGSGATINIYNGEFTFNKPDANAMGAPILGVWDEGSKINIYGGTFDAEQGALNYSSAAIEIFGGTFKNAAKVVFGNTEGIKIFVANGYKAIANSDGTYTVMNDKYSISVSDGVYADSETEAEVTVYGVTSAAGWAWVESQADNFFAGKTVKLENDIDFGGATIPSIKFWNAENKTIFDGNEKTLSNFVVTNTSGNSGLVNGTLTIKNLTVEKATATGKYVGVLAGNMYGDIENCTVRDSTVNGTYWQTGVLCGQYNAGNITGCVIENCTINGKAAVGALVGILNETTGVRKIENCTVSNCTINQTGSFGGDYDDMFGAAIGLINISDSQVYFTDCTIEENTVKGVASNDLYGIKESGTEVIVTP